MKTLRSYAAVLLLAVGTTAPLVLADDNHRYYDKEHKDYHHWNADEERNYTLFLNEHHITVHTWKKAKPTEQQQYWNWRHEHPDEKR